MIEAITLGVFLSIIARWRLELLIKKAEKMQREIKLDSKFEKFTTHFARNGYQYKIQEVDNIAAYNLKTAKWSDEDVEIIRK